MGAVCSILRVNRRGTAGGKKSSATHFARRFRLFRDEWRRTRICNQLMKS